MSFRISATPSPLAGSGDWRAELVCHGSRVLLEVRRHDLRCSTWLQPLDSPVEAAHRLIATPACALGTRS
jgi:hypothetical protein